MQHIFQQYTNEELCQIVNELNSEFIPEDSLARKAAKEFFRLEDINVVRLIGLGLPVAIELSKRLKECQSSLS